MNSRSEKTDMQMCWARVRAARELCVFGRIIGGIVFLGLAYLLTLAGLIQSA